MAFCTPSLGNLEELNHMLIPFPNHQKLFEHRHPHRLQFPSVHQLLIVLPPIAHVALLRNKLGGFAVISFEEVDGILPSGEPKFVLSHNKLLGRFPALERWEILPHHLLVLLLRHRLGHVLVHLIHELRAKVNHLLHAAVLGKRPVLVAVDAIILVLGAIGIRAFQFLRERHNHLTAVGGHDLTDGGYGLATVGGTDLP